MEKRNKDQNTVSIVNSSGLLTNSVSTIPNHSFRGLEKPEKAAVLRAFYHLTPKQKFSSLVVLREILVHVHS